LDDKRLTAARAGRSVHRGMGRMVALAAVVLVAALMLAALAGWGVLAIYFGDSHRSPVQTVLAGAFGLAGFAAIAGMAIPRWRARIVGAFLALFVVVLAWWFSLAPSNDRVWQPDVARLAYATIDGDRITVHNIRNFDYRTETDFTPAYYDKTSTCASSMAWTLSLPTGWGRPLPIFF
jgi:hypothetical protein